MPFKNFNPQSFSSSSSSSSSDIGSDNESVSPSIPSRPAAVPIRQAIGALQYDLSSSVLNRLPKDTSPESLAVWFAERRRLYPRLKQRPQNELCEYSSSSSSSDDDDAAPKEIPIGHSPFIDPISTPLTNPSDENSDILNSRYSQYLTQYGFHPMVIFLCAQYPPAKLPLPQLFSVMIPITNDKRKFGNKLLKSGPSPHPSSNKKRAQIYLPSLLECTTQTNPFLSMIIAVHAEHGLQRQQQQKMLQNHYLNKRKLQNEQQQQDQQPLDESEGIDEPISLSDHEQLLSTEQTIEQQPTENSLSSTGGSLSVENSNDLTVQNDSKESQTIAVDTVIDDGVHHSTPFDENEPNLLKRDQIIPHPVQILESQHSHTSQLPSSTSNHPIQRKSIVPTRPQASPQALRPLLLEPLLTSCHLLLSQTQSKGMNSRALTLSALTKSFTNGTNHQQKQQQHYRKMQNEGQLQNIQYVDLYKKLLSADLAQEGQRLIRLLAEVMKMYNSQHH